MNYGLLWPVLLQKKGVKGVVRQLWAREGFLCREKASQELLGLLVRIAFHSSAERQSLLAKGLPYFANAAALGENEN